MSPRNRIFLGLVLVYVAGVGALLWQLLKDIDPRYRESAEESLVEVAHLMATLVEQASPDDQTIDVEGLEPLFKSAYARNVDAEIFGFHKSGVELRLVVTDRKGIVLYDSMERHVGEDYSQWRDVRLTLKGEYGARTSPDIDDDASTSVMYVGAPIRLGNGIAGVVSAGKPVQSLNQFIVAARRKTLIVGAASAAAMAMLMVLMAVWLARPFGLIRDYIRYVKTQGSFSLPRLSRRAVATIGAAYTEMRDAVSGRSPVADYVQTLTHELKSPLSSIRGAAELLQEAGMPEPDRQRFLGNITRETQRIQETVDKMMELASLESLRTLADPKPVALRALLEDVAASAQAAAAPRGITVATDIDRDATVIGDAFMLRRAVGNLLDNAIDFSDDGARVDLALAIDPKTATITVRDRGPGLPEGAGDKPFEKFYSLARPRTTRRSTGLGLPFVKEVIALHDGKVSLANVDATTGTGAASDGAGGAIATIVLPRGDRGDRA